MSAIEWQVKLDLAYTRGIVLVNSKTIGLSPMEVEALLRYNRPHDEVLAWLWTHEQTTSKGKPRRYAHSHAIDHLLTDDELATWSKADGWHWSFKYGLAWTSQGKRSTAKPGKDRRLRVNSKGLYWWIMMEWLARTAPYTAVQVMRGNFEIHHLKPYLLDKPKGNALANLRIVRAVPEHSYVSSAQRKIRKWWKDHHSL
ncbi:hypothetical protein PS376_07065 [Limosilactobacillus pontis]|uniref:hypothetical protein n=1 Tax=Limosilactobacillus pontis TaxID=35787 RepID=UPI002F268C22